MNYATFIEGAIVLIPMLAAFTAALALAAFVCDKLVQPWLDRRRGK